ncbi:alpha/beta hydrolase family protein [Burkholderiaceae bacterium UC74_6]
MFSRLIRHAKFRTHLILPLLGLAFLQINTQADAAPPSQPPLEAFTALPFMESATLTPDGKRVAAVINLSDSSAVVSRPAAGGQPAVLFKADNSEMFINWIHWASNDRLLISVRFPTRAIMEGLGNTLIVHSRLFAVDASGGKPINLFKASSTGFGGVDAGPNVQDDVIDFMRDDGHHVLLQLNTRSDYAAPSVYKVDIDTGKREMVQGSTKDVRSWVSDWQHRVRIGYRTLDKGETQILVRPPEGGDWQVLWSQEALKNVTLQVLGFGRDPQLLYVARLIDGYWGIYSVRLDQAGKEFKLVYKAEKFDSNSRLIFDQTSGEAVGIAIAQIGNSSTSYWDPRYQALAKGLDDVLPKRFNELGDVTDDLGSFIFESSAPDVPPELYVALGDSIVSLAKLYEGLKPGTVAAKQALTLRARDGLELPAFLTLPPDSSGKKLPTVVLVHGGPQSQDQISFDPEVAFLAAQGYAVLQVEFRGSTGHGEKLMKAGYRRWGLEMQDDLADAVKAIEAQGITDPQRVCIMGGSYGGYAALMGGIKQADVFKCVVAYAAPTDLLDLLKWSQFSAGFSSVVTTRQIGSIYDDREQLISTSPQRRAADMKLPVLLMHGDYDDTVEFSHGQLMADALKAAGKDVRFVVLPKSDHYIANQANRKLYFREVQTFLAKYLK